MATKHLVYAVGTFLHDLFTAAWVGGLFTLVLSVSPAARKSLGRQTTQRLMDEIQKRLSIVIYISMAGLAGTGMLLSNRAPGFAGLFGFATPYATVLSVKHFAMLAMVAVALMRSLAVPGISTSAHKRARLSLALLRTNLGLGILMIVLSGFIAAFRVTPPTMRPIRTEPSNRTQEPRRRTQRIESGCLSSASCSYHVETDRPHRPLDIFHDRGYTVHQCSLPRKEPVNVRS